MRFSVSERDLRFMNADGLSSSEQGLMTSAMRLWSLAMCRRGLLESHDFLDGLGGG